MKFKKRDDGVFVLRGKGQILGHAIFEIKHKTLKIPYLSIVEKFRNKGIGRILMKKIIGFGVSKNCNKFELDVDHQNEQAIALYKKFGFKKLKTKDTFICMEKHD